LRQEICGDAISVQDRSLAATVHVSRFVIENGMVFKRDGVMMPEAFFHPGPVRGWRAK